MEISEHQNLSSRSPIDLVLEATKNTDAACQRTGVLALTKSIFAWKKWAESHFPQTAIISKVFEGLGMTKKEDVSNNLRPYRIHNDHANLNKVIVMIQETMNPVDVNLDPNKLYIIGTGLIAMDSTQNLLLNVECSQDSQRFEKPIKRQKTISFATETGKQKITASNGKVLSACFMCNLFRSILYIWLQRKVDIAIVSLKHPLTPVPLSLSHVNGTKLRKPKSALLTYLETKEAITTPDEIDV